MQLQSSAKHVMLIRCSNSQNDYHTAQSMCYNSLTLTRLASVRLAAVKPH